MPKIEGKACVLCMASPTARKTFRLDRLRRSAEMVALEKFTECFAVDQDIVDSSAGELPGSKPIARDIILDGIRLGRYTAVFLYGDILTSFGEEVYLTAKASGLKVFISAFGDGTFGRRYRAWYKRQRQAMLPGPDAQVVNLPG